jgi:glycogen(starch) synthase
MLASVIINTYNREPYLRDCIESLKRQSYHTLEVIVVNGPSTDGTEAYLRTLGSEVKILNCPGRNLSKSRNIGIEAARGDFIAFIDDDAAAHPRWLERLASAYKDSDVAAVGGFTLDNTGRNFQSRFTISDTLGGSRQIHNKSVAELVLEDPTQYLSLLGANSSFRRSDLLEIGGFDEVFEYYLDETDVCYRLHALGRKIQVVPEAYVLHRYAPSYVRDDRRVPKNYLTSVRSKVYFCHIHFVGNSDQRDAHLAEYRSSLQFSLKWHLHRALISASDFHRLMGEIELGFKEGIEYSIATKSASDYQTSRLRLAESDVNIFSLVGAKREGKSLRVAFVSQGYPPQDTSGIARWTKTIAKAASELGCDVHVITRATSHLPPSTDYIDGVWVHRYEADKDTLLLNTEPSLPDSTHAWAAGVRREAERIKQIWGLDVISAPIWDVEGIRCFGINGVKVVTSLHTTFGLMVPFKPEWRFNLRYMRNHVSRLVTAEEWLFNRSDLVIANSVAIIDDMRNTYGVLSNKRIATVPHGIPSADAAKSEKGTSDPITVLYVGRIEPRKGLDILLESLLNVRLHHEIIFKIVGSRPSHDAYSKSVSELIAKVAATENITVIEQGYVGDEELEEAYRTADVVVIPSRYESFGLVTVEAMRYGIAVIAAEVGGMAEIFQHGKSGLYFPAEDLSALSSLIETVVNDSALRVDIGKNALSHFESTFTDRIMAKTYVNALNKCVAG